MQKTNDFTHGALFPMILKFSIPAAISLLIAAIYNIVDRMFVGNFVGTSALAGLSICFPLSVLHDGGLVLRHVNSNTNHFHTSAVLLGCCSGPQGSLLL